MNALGNSWPAWFLVTSRIAAGIGCHKGADRNKDAPVISATSASAPFAEDAAAKAAAAAPKPIDDRRVAVPVNPPAVTKIAFECSHSNGPWGTGSQEGSIVYLLADAKWMSERSETPNRPRPSSSRGYLASARVAQLREHVANVLAGGPYNPEYPSPEGVSCKLSLSAKTGEPFFAIDKAKSKENDAVSALFRALALGPKSDRVHRTLFDR
jgi:hypothetical protein